MTRNLVTLAEAAAHYSCSPRTIRRRVSDGTLTGHRMPGSSLLRVDLAELDALWKPIPAAGASRPLDKVSPELETWIAEQRRKQSRRDGEGA